MKSNPDAVIENLKAILEQRDREHSEALAEAVKLEQERNALTHENDKLRGEALEQARANGTLGQREAELLAQNAALSAENTALRDTIQAVVDTSAIPIWLRERCVTVLAGKEPHEQKNEKNVQDASHDPSERY